MNDTIKDIFHNYLSEETSKNPTNKEYLDITAKEYELYAKLKECTSAKLFDLINEYIDCSTDREAMENENYFVSGFKIGLRLGCETFAIDYNEE